MSSGGSRTRRMMRLQAQMRKEEIRQRLSKRRLAPDHIQRLQALKMEGKATFAHPKDMPKDSPNYQRWAAENPKEAKNDESMDRG